MSSLHSHTARPLTRSRKFPRLPLPFRRRWPVVERTLGVLVSIVRTFVPETPRWK